MLKSITSLIEIEIFFSVFNLHSKFSRKTLKLSDNAFSIKPVSTFQEFHNVVMPMLITLGPGLHRNPVLMFKIVRIVREALINVIEVKLLH